jgi:anti-sigma factor RsiW
MNACPRWSDRLLDFSFGALEASALSEVEEHLQDCPACAARLGELRPLCQRLDAGVRQLVGGAAPSPGFRARLLSATEASATGAGWQPAWRGALAAVVSVLALVVAPSLADRWFAPAAPAAADSVTTLLEWRSPTESLLRSPTAELLQSAPRLGEFYFPLDSVATVEGGEVGGNDES